MQHALLNRRTLLKLGSLAGAGWMTPVAELLARDAQSAGEREPAQSVIMLWMAGGPSQLETFDPHPDKMISGETRAIDTPLPGVQLAEGMEQTAAEMQSIALVRNMVSKEGDHERGTYLVKTGYSPIPTAVHPSIGAICCHALPLELPGGLKTEIPRHVSIMSNQWWGRGGFLGDEYDAFRVFDPNGPVPDVATRVGEERIARRVRDLDVVEQAFARGRARRAEGTLHRQTLDFARRMMTSDQLKAFEVNEEPAELRAAYGDNPFGRGCLAARRLIEKGVRCVEVNLNGWDTHANNHEFHRQLKLELDPAFSTLLRDLRDRDLLDRTVVLCCGEFGRTPNINPLAGRDHWPNGFSIALAGGGIRGGVVLGQTDPEGAKLTPEQGHSVPDIHATVLRALGVNHRLENIAPGPRPIRLADGDPIPELLLDG